MCHPTRAVHECHPLPVMAADHCCWLGPTLPTSRRAAIRLMFDTAVGAIVAARDKLDGDRPGDAYRDEAEVRRAKREAKRWEGGYGPGEFTGISVDFPQVLTICRNVHSMVTINEAAALYRDAYEVGVGAVHVSAWHPMLTASCSLSVHVCTRCVGACVCGCRH